MKIAPVACAFLVMISACAGNTASWTTPDQPTSTSSPVTTTSTSKPPSTIESSPTTSFQRFDEATLQPVGSPLILSGYLAEEHVALPDGRLVLFTFDENDWRSVLFDPDANRVEFETEAPFTMGGVRPLGYSPALEQVVMYGFEADSQSLYLYDPATGSFDDEPAFGGDDLGWVHQAALIDEGRKVAIYETFGYDEARIGESPQVRVGDLVTNTLGPSVEVTRVVHGHAELTPDAIRNPEWPYGEVEPAIVFDEVGARLFVVHADGAGLTTVDLLAGRITVKDFAEPPSFWTRVMSWLVPPAQAKGSEPSAYLSAWLNDDRSQLYVTGEANDAWRDAENKLHTTHTPLGLMVINTETLELDKVLGLPVNVGLPTSSAVVLTGSGGTRIWCDEVCKPGNNEPEVEGEYESSGLILLDPNTLDINRHLSPGQGFHLRGVVDDWLFVETPDEEVWGYETINLITGERGGRAEISGPSYFIITDHGLFLASQSG